MYYSVQAAEAKTRRKEEKKNLRAQQKSALEANGRGGDDDEGSSGGEGNDDVEGEESHFDGVATLGGPTGARKSSSKSTEGTSAAMAGGASVFPSASTAGDAAKVGTPSLVLDSDLPHLAAVLDKADVVIEILDARDPLAHRSSVLEVRVTAKEGQKLLLVLNKIGACALLCALYVHTDGYAIDTCPREPTAAWAAYLRSEHPTLLFRVASSFLPPVITHEQPSKGKGKSKEPSNDAWGLDAVSQLLGSWAQEKMGDEPLHVAVVGLANVRSFLFPCLWLIVSAVVRKERVHKFACSLSRT
jgi:nuclear GTP-binding protein